MGVKFGWYYKMAYLCTALKQNAEIAQLVEHNLAKVRVASSSLVFRSREKISVEAVSYTHLTLPTKA